MPMLFKFRSGTQCCTTKFKYNIEHPAFYAAQNKVDSPILECIFILSPSKFSDGLEGGVKVLFLLGSSLADKTL